MFKGTKKLNRTLSRGCNALMRSLENMITYIPTREGKTNMAILSIPNIIGHHRRARSGDDKENLINNTYGYNLRSFKIVYVALLKALIQEVFKNISWWLNHYIVHVWMLEDRLSCYNKALRHRVLATTPNKWDIVTQKGEDIYVWVERPT